MNKPFVFSFLSTKGGVGKSTITFNMAMLFASTFPDKKIVIAETDMQQSIKSMCDKFAGENRNFPEIIYVGSSATAADMREKLASTGADFIFLDGAGTINSAFNQSVRCSDFIVWMAGKSLIDIEPLPTCTDDALSLNKRGAYLMNGVTRNESVYGLCKDLLVNSPRFNSIPLLQNDLRKLSAYEKAYALGLAVIEMDSSANNAKEDLENVADEILKMALEGIQ